MEDKLHAYARKTATDESDGTRTAVRNSGDGLLLPRAIDNVLREPGTPPDRAVRDEMETRLGADFARVRIHDNKMARQSASMLAARAYTVGDHVVIGDGGGDKRTLAHELTHVIQQRHGPVDGTEARGGLRISDPGDRYERDAEVNASRVMTGAAPRAVPNWASSASVGVQVQCFRTAKELHEFGRPQRPYFVVETKKKKVLAG